MKLYSTVCFGLLVVFVCNGPKTETVSDFCKLTAAEIRQLQALTPDEKNHLQRPRKDAIASLRRSYQTHCVPPERRK